MRLILIFAVVLSVRAATVVRMACGGPGGTDPAGNVWAGDSKVGGGTAWTVANQPALASQPGPYQALCYSSGSVPFSRTFTVAPGNYSVTLKWLDPNKTAAGQRIFGAAINGVPVAVGLDVFAAAGGALKAYDQTFPVSAPGGFIQVTLSGTVGNALLSAVQIDSVPVVADDGGGKITCDSGKIAAGVDLTADAPSQEVTILTAVPGNRRWDQITICPTDRFVGASLVTASIGRPGTSDNELLGPDVTLTDASSNSNCWTARPIPPQMSGKYDVVVNFKAFATDGSGMLIPGSIKSLTGGSATWEACGYAGKISDAAGLPSKPVGAAMATALQRCSGSGGVAVAKTAWDCAGLLWAQIKLGDGSMISMMGVPMAAPAANPALTWSEVK